MQPQDIKAALKPHYDKFEELCEKGDILDAVNYYHSQGVIVKTGDKVAFGREHIVTLFKEYLEKIGQHKCELINDTYQGTDDYLIVHSDFEVHTKKSSNTHKGKFIHIWTKENGKWVIYHEEFEMH